MSPSAVFTRPSPSNITVSDTETKPIVPFVLKGTVTVVSGGAQGIGLEIARGISQLGGNVAVLDKVNQPPGFEDLEKTSGVKTRYYVTDVTDKKSLEQTFANIIHDFGRIDGCVTAAGIMIVEEFLKYNWEDAVKVQMVNVIGTFMTAQHAANQMKVQGSGGSIVLISSVAAHVSSPALHISAYTASKGAVKSLAQALAVELGPVGIRVNTISPGYIRTDMTDKAIAANPKMGARLTYEPPLGRIGETQDLTGAVAFLLSNSASYVSGTDILVTGGLHAGRYPEDRGIKENGIKGTSGNGINGRDSE